MVLTRIFLAGVTLALTSASLEPPQGRCEGRVVVHGREHEIVFDAVVTLRPVDGRGAAQTVATDERGRFEFSGVADGVYEVMAAKRAFLRSHYGARRPERAGAPVEIQGGRAVTGLVVKLWRAGVISGIVTDADSQPVPGAPVSAVRSTDARSRARSIGTPISGRAVTDDRGVYRIFGLPPGDYAIAARPPQAMRPAGRGRSVSAVYYPSALDPSAAAIVRVVAGGETDAVDVRLQVVPSAAITAVLQPPPGVDLSDLAVTVIVATPSVSSAIGVRRSAALGAGGTVTATDLPPARYVIDVTARAPRDRSGEQEAPVWWGRVEVTATADETATATIPLQPSSTIRGRVTLAGSRGASTPRIEVRLTSDPHDVAPFSALVRAAADGSFVFGGLPAGRFHLVAVAEGSAGETDRVVDIAPGQHLSDVVMTVGDARAGIAGTVVDQAGERLPDVAVVVFPVDRQYWRDPSRRIRETRTSAKGTFVIAGLPAGEYGIAMADDLEVLDAPSLEGLLARRDLQRVTLDEPRLYQLTILR